MTKKTRIRVARIAAGAVIAAGASLSAAGAASALDLGVDLGGAGVNASVDEDGVGVDVHGPKGDDPTGDPTVIPTDPTDEPTDPTDEPTDPTDEPTDPTDEPTDPTDEPTDPTDEPTDPTDEPTDPTGEPTDPTGEPTGQPTHGGGDHDGTNPDGGSKPVEQGKGKDGLSQTGTKPVEQVGDKGKDKGELAETGAAETTFLVIGAATMIAGGIGFRILPRLVGNRGAAA
ncbi:hypothetical protein ACQB60_28210 [Actinomycetota bacterium Odt1-20B]